MTVTFVWIALAIIVVALLVIVGLVLTRTKRGGTTEAPPRPTTTAPPAPSTREPGVGDDAAPPRDTSTRTIDEVVLPDDAASGGDTAVLEVETPDPVAAQQREQSLAQRRLRPCQASSQPAEPASDRVRRLDLEDGCFAA